jgi:hypothetical protein
MNDRRRAAAVVVAAALAGLGGCEDGLPGREPLQVNAVSRAKLDLTGTSWEQCTELPSGSQRYREVHGEEGAISFTLTAFEDPGCTGTATPSSGFSAYGEARGDTSVTWTGTSPAGLPDPPPPATKVLLDAGSGSYGLDVYLVDDTVSPRVLYTGEPGAPTDAEGYPAQLHAVPEVER